MISSETPWPGLVRGRRVLVLMTFLLSATLAPNLISSAMGIKYQDPQEKAGQQNTKPKPPKTQKEKAELTIKERVMVVGDPAAIRDIPGSAHFITRSQMDEKKTLFGDIHRILRQVPGVNMQDEDGFGLRPNIGLRGSGSERSSKITLMEDGVLVAPAPYAASSAYYFPTAGRMSAIEIRKGSSQIKYGPRTNGGALNLVSTPIPSDLGINARITGGEHSTGRLQLQVGDSQRNYGWLLETYQIQTGGFKKLDNGGDTGHEIQDYMAKFRLNSDPDASVYQSLEVKLGKTKQVSDETYLGLTDDDFRTDPLRRYAASQEDVFRSEHDQYQLRYFASLTSSIDFTAVAYRNEFFRNWYKLQSIAGTKLSKMFGDPEKYADVLAIAKGSNSDVNALKLRANSRNYYGQGVQTVFGWRPSIGAATNQVEFGLRYHEDQEDRLQHEDGYQMVDGLMSLTKRGAAGSQSNRISDARAWAVFVQDQIQWGRWSIVPGVRFESIELVRTDYSKTDPSRSSPTRVRTNELTIAVPGIGLGYDISPEMRIFGGVHKGFAPPGPGTDEFTEAEESINYELGARFDRRGVGFELTTFLNDYSNLLGADTLASGGTGTGDLYNGGEVGVRGLEATASYQIALPDSPILSIPMRGTYTYTDASFENSFDSKYGPWGTVEEGDKLPYIPEHQFALGIGVELSSWRASLDASYNSQMRTTASQGPIDALIATDSFFVWDFSTEVDLRRGVAVFGAVQNLTNSAYIVARRPYGARPSLPRTLVAGVQLDF